MHFGGLTGYALKIRKYLKDIIWNAAVFAKWVIIAVFIGSVVGLAGTAFYYALYYVTKFRTEHTYMIYLLPAIGIVIILFYRLFKVKKPDSTSLVLKSIQTGQPLPGHMAPLVTISTLLTHLGGGSAGREGAALQLGGSMGNYIGKLLRLDEKDRNIITLCGMGAAFTALFGTPAASAVFAMEVVTVGVMCYAAIVPCVMSSVTAYMVARALGVRPTSFPLSAVPDLELIPVLQVIGLAIMCAVLSIGFCFVIKKTGWLYKKLFANQYIRIAAGGALVAVLSLIFGQDYLGAGGEIIAKSIQGTARPEAFILKLIFTALTLGAGFQGGEIVPAFFTGATFGYTVGGLIGMDPSFAAAIGLTAVFCGVTNCPIAALVISLELFGFDGMIFYLIAVAVSYMLSGYGGLYKTQRIYYSKFKYEKHEK